MAAILYLSANPHAIDIALVTKRTAVFRWAELDSVDLHQIGAIGDGGNDIPFLTIPGLGLIGAPANAEPRVKAVLETIPGAVVLDGSVTEGFLTFYELCARRGLRLILSDRDGVLVDGGKTDAERFQSVVARVMRGPGPALRILTGSSVAQNLSLLAGLSADVVDANRVMVLAENGSVAIDPVTRRTHLALPREVEAVLPILKGPFETALRRLMASSILPRYGLTPVDARSTAPDDLWIPEKATMITIDLPYRFRDRANPSAIAAATRFKDDILRLAERLGREVGFAVEFI